MLRQWAEEDGTLIHDTIPECKVWFIDNTPGEDDNGLEDSPAFEDVTGMGLLAVFRPASHISTQTKSQAGLMSMHSGTS